MARRFVIPQQGVISGGRLDGWRYLFLRFRVDRIEHGDEAETVSEELVVLARCTPPAWPFPCDIALDQWEHFKELRPLPGQRTKYLDAAALIESAYTIEGYDVPPALQRLIDESRKEKHESR
jgi:hypothetical protein